LRGGIRVFDALYLDFGASGGTDLFSINLFVALIKRPIKEVTLCRSEIAQKPPQKSDLITHQRLRIFLSANTGVKPLGAIEY
jgi:hypothetical protein